MKLYKTNSVDDRGYELTAEEIADRFRVSEQHGYWHQGWPLDRALRGVHHLRARRLDGRRRRRLLRGARPRPRAGQEEPVSLRQRRQYGVGFDRSSVIGAGGADERMHVTLVPERAADRDRRHELVLSREDAAQLRTWLTRWLDEPPAE